jgi:hypothetical protein
MLNVTASVGHEGTKKIMIEPSMIISIKGVAIAGPAVLGILENPRTPYHLLVINAWLKIVVYYVIW